jgi:hypothetical protein
VTARVSARGRRVMWPLASPGSMLDDSDVIHARSAQRHAAACGKDLRHLTAIAQESSPDLAVVMAWPPYKTEPADGWTRCPACWEATGRPRPSHSWRRSS